MHGETLVTPEALLIQTVQAQSQGGQHDQKDQQPFNWGQSLWSHNPT